MVDEWWINPTLSKWISLSFSSYSFLLIFPYFILSFLFLSCYFYFFPYFSEKIEKKKREKWKKMIKVTSLPIRHHFSLYQKYVSGKLIGQRFFLLFHSSSSFFLFFFLLFSLLFSVLFVTCPWLDEWWIHYLNPELRVYILNRCMIETLLLWIWLGNIHNMVWKTYQKISTIAIYVYGHILSFLVQFFWW